MRRFRQWGVDSPFCWQSCLILLLGLLILTSELAAPSAAFAQAPPLPTVLDSNFEVLEFFTVSPVSSANFGGGTLVAAAPGTGAFGTDVFLADPGAFSDTLDGRIFRLSDLNGDGDALDAGESTLAINNTLRSPLSMDFGFGGDLFILDYPQSSSLRFIYKLTNAATPVLSQHTTNGIFNHNSIQFLPLDGGGEQLIINAAQNFTIFGGTNDGRLFRTGSTSGQPSVEWSNGTNITEGVPAGWWDPNFQSGVFPGNWLLVRNGAFKDSSGTIHGSGSLWAVKDVNNDGDANDPGEARVMIPDPNVPIGAIRFDSNGVGYGFGGVNVWRFEDLNNDGDFWDFGAGAFDAGENEVFITGTISFQSIDLGPNGEIYLTAASGTSPNFTSHTYLVRPTFQTTPPADLTSGLVGHWAMDEAAGSTTAVDSSGSSNTATCSGTACPTFGVSGSIGTAASFDGSNDFLQVNNTIPNSFTIAAWIKTTSVGPNTAVGQGYGGSGIIYSDVPGGHSDMIPMALVSDRLGFDTGSANNCTSDDTLTSTVGVNTGQWVHVAVTRDMTTGVKQLYINGVLNATNSNGGTCALSGNPNILFGGNTVDSRYFNGQMDDVYFYNRVLSASDIQSLMSGIITTPPVVSSICGPGNPAAISGSTGEQGMLDPANTNASLGLVWPAGAVFAAIDIDTGGVLYYNSTPAQIGNAVLPGVSGFPAFPEGKLNFTSVHLPTGKSVFFFSTSLGLPPPLIILSCQDVILESTSILGIGGLSGGQPTLTGTSTLIQLPANFLGGSGPSLLPVAAAGFGPRTGSLPSSGSLYPPIGGGGGNGGANLAGGEGGEAIVIAAAQRITVNGLISANGSNPLASATAAQGGAGGSVRLAAVLVEGDGIIDTSGGLDSNGGKTSLDGPIEIQAFLQDLFTGTASTTPIRGNPVVAPIPDNLPTIQVVGVNVATSEFCGFECSNTGSLSAPDVILPEASSPVAVTVEVFTRDVPLGTLLTFRAVGTDGSVVTAVASVQACDCLEGEGFAVDGLTLNPGATYQIVVYPDSGFALANLNTNPTPMRTKPVYAGLQMVPNEQKSGLSRAKSREDRSQTKVAADPSGTRDISPLEKWARAFGTDPEAHKKMAQLKTAP